jgi:serine/threonine protein kinase
LVAIKKQDHKKDVPDKNTMQELAILNRLRVGHHDQCYNNIIVYYGAFDDISTNGEINSLYIVLEYCQNGDLLEILLNYTIQLGWKFLISLAKQAAAALKIVHDKHILHRDIKSAVGYSG